jgi:phosphoglycerol transferase MdoB-like AlkP superfamily enzyme
LWLAVVLVGVKTRYVPFLDYASPAAMGSWLLNLLVVSGADVLFVIALGVIGQVALWGTGRWPGVQRGVWWGLVGVCVACAAYGVASVRFIEYLRMPLTYRLVRLGSDLTNMVSSLRAEASGGMVGAVVLVPAFYAVIVWASERWLKKRELTWHARVRAGVVVGVVLLACLWGNAEARRIWRTPHQERPWPWQHEDRRLAESAHYVLVSTAANEWLGAEDAVRLGEEFPAEYLNDFKSYAESGDSRLPTEGLKRGPKSVIVVVLESVGTQYLSVYGSSYGTTTRLELETSYCLMFDDFYSHVTNTASSLIALTLSQYPPRTWRHGTEERSDMPGTSAAAVLKGRGYRTAFISAGDNRFAKQHEFLKGRGFDDVWDYRDSGCEPRPEFSWGVNDRCLVDVVLKWVDRDPKGPFYVMSWTQGTHHPYEPSPEEPMQLLAMPREPGNLHQYLNAIAEVDRQLVRLFDGLRARGLENKVMVVITGDHGEGFGEPHGNWGHTGKIYQEDVNVPLVVWSPALFQKHQRSNVVGAHVDLGPTVLDLLGVECPGDWEGRSLFSKQARGRAYFFGMLDSVLLGVREGGFKYIYDVTHGREQLFHVADDPIERHEMAGDLPEKSKKMRQRLAAWVAGTK